MKFEVTPVIAIMRSLYQRPRSIERFHHYIALLEGGRKGDLLLPISGFNPMGKEHLITKLDELTALHAEDMMASVAAKLNATLPAASPTIQLVLNLVDDLHGGWTDRYTTDYTAKFKLNALVQRNFCTPYLWSSEAYSEQLVAERTLEYAHRTLYWIKNGKTTTLEQHVAQEAYVAAMCGGERSTMPQAVEEMRIFYNTHRHTEDHNIIFNFLYGNAACRLLGYPTFELSDGADGFEYAAGLSVAT